MKINLECVIIIVISQYEYTEAQTSALDAFVPELRILRDKFLKIFTPSSENENNLRLAINLRKLQPRLSDDVSFPCLLNNTRSRKPPSSVHALRPGDIDVIGAIGDSLTAGNGLVATNILQVAIQNRGLSFTIGGQSTWRQYLTLPNILKEFNPKLIGYSLKDSFVHHYASQFNVAEGGAISSNMPFMAKELVRRIKKNPRVNINKDWKMISFMIGNNDFCSEMCYYKNPEAILELHRKDLTRVLRTLRDNLPRTIVNIILTPHLKELRSTTIQNRPPLCFVSHSFVCPCIFGLRYQNQQKRFDQIMRKWQEIEVQVVNDPEFDREDFAVVAQTFTVNYKLNKTPEGLTDYSALSEDCFHLGQKEGARAALSLWNNILEPVGNKSMTPTDLFHFKCPSQDDPYIFTNKNSLSYRRSM